MAKIVSGKYELLEVLRDGDIRTWRARQVTLGHELMVHFISGSQQGDDFAVLDRLAKLPDSARKLFFDAGDHESVPYVVSWPLPEFDSLPDWLDRTLRKQRPQTAPATIVHKTGPTDPGEFSRIFFKGVKEPSAPPSVKEPPVPPKEAGEFTRLFEVPVNPSTPAKPAASPPPVPAAKEATPTRPGSGPGEFTQFFQRSPFNEPRPPSREETEVLPHAPLFPPGRAAEQSLETIDLGAPLVRPVPRPKPPSVNPAPFTPPAAGPSIASSPVASPLGAGQSPIQAPAANAFSAPRPPAPPAPPSAPQPPQLAGADDYDRVIARPAAPPLAPAAPPKPAAALPSVPQVPRPAPSRYLPMWITLAVLLVLAVALTLFVVLTR